MRRTYWVKTTVGCVSALAISLSCCPMGQDLTAATLCKETEMAGISLSLDKYTEDQVGMDAPASVVSDEAASEALTEATEAPAVPDAAAPVAPVADAAAPAADAAAPEPTPQVAKQFQTTALSTASDYVNIRKTPSTEGKILGKLYEGSSAKILKEKDGWTQIESGSVTGYIKSEFLATGAKAEKLASKYGTYYAKVKPGTITLNVRKKPNTTCTILTQIPEDESYEVVSIGKNWVKISIDGDKGWVAKEFVNLHAKFKKAISIEEERAEERRKAEAAAAEQERLNALAAEQARQEQQSQSSSSSSQSSSSSSSSSSSGSSSSRSSSSSSRRSSSSSSSSKRSSSSQSSSSGGSVTASGGSGSAIASYAQKFVGNKYVYGGSSLTNGTDCSGFTMSVYLQFGYSLPHSSAAQANCGKKVSLSSLQPGDLVFYKNGGSIGHVAMYIGGGQVVHASNPTNGIMISSVRYRTPVCARRIVG